MNALLLSSASPGDPAAVRGAVVRDRIVAAGYRLFVQHGFAEVSIERIAEAAGVSRRTVYNKFIDKVAIYRAAVEPAIAELEAVAQVAPAPSSDDPRAMLRRHADALVAVLDHPKMIDLLRLLVLDREVQPWVARAFVAQIRLPLRAALRADLEAAVAAGQLAPGEAAVRVEQFFGTLLGLIAYPRLLQLPPERGATPAHVILDSSLDALLAGWALRTVAEV